MFDPEEFARWSAASRAMLGDDYDEPVDRRAFTRLAWLADVHDGLGALPVPDPDLLSAATQLGEIRLYMHTDAPLRVDLTPAGFQHLAEHALDRHNLLGGPR